MRNLLLDSGTTQEIDKLVARVHRDLGHPEGAVDLPSVRDLLRLDLRYYSASDPSLLQEVVHKMRVGARQVIQRPGLLLEAVRKLDLKALFLPDRQRILLDADLPDLKKRWNEAHETAHSLIPWHKEYMLGDTKETLSPACHELLEAEANYGAGRLLFPQKPMATLAASASPSIGHVKAIAKHFGNTITSALWHYVEHHELPCAGVIGVHPHYLPEGATPIEYFVRSRRFVAEFAGITEEIVFQALRSYCSYKKSGPVGLSELTLMDGRGVAHVFRAESFSNGYQVLTLISHARVTAPSVQPGSSVIA